MFLIRLICIGVISLSSFALGNVRYPTIVWHPMNPLFSCDNPKIHVRVNDQVNLQCPTDEYNFYSDSSAVKMLYENLYFVGTDKHRYDTCNAAGMSAGKLLNCRDGVGSYYPIVFQVFGGPDQLSFVRGETYYLIGTGFRVEGNLNNTVNGSCSKTDTFGKYKLRLQIYVCKDDKDCDICESASCYYKDCGWNCDEWRNMTYSVGEGCKVLRTRKCTNAILGQSKHETNFTDISCPTPTTPSATTTSPVTTSEPTSTRRKTEITDPKNITVPTTVTIITSTSTKKSPQIGKLVKENTDKVVLSAVASGLAFLVLGIGIGMFWSKLGQKLICRNNKNRVKDRTISSAVVLPPRHGSSLTSFYS